MRVWAPPGAMKGGSKPSVGQVGCVVEGITRHLIIHQRSQGSPASGFGQWRTAELAELELLQRLATSLVSLQLFHKASLEICKWANGRQYLRPLKTHWPWGLHINSHLQSLTLLAASGMLQANWDLPKVTCDRLSTSEDSLKSKSENIRSGGYPGSQVCKSGCVIPHLQTKLRSSSRISGKEQLPGDYFPWQAPIYTYKTV